MLPPVFSTLQNRLISWGVKVATFEQSALVHAGSHIRRVGGDIGNVGRIVDVDRACRPRDAVSPDHVRSLGDIHAGAAWFHQLMDEKATTDADARAGFEKLFVAVVGNKRHQWRVDIGALDRDFLPRLQLRVFEQRPDGPEISRGSINEFLFRAEPGDNGLPSGLSYGCKDVDRDTLSSGFWNAYRDRYEDAHWKLGFPEIRREAHGYDMLLMAGDGYLSESSRGTNFGIQPQIIDAAKSELAKPDLPPGERSNFSKILTLAEQSNGMPPPVPEMWEFGLEQLASRKIMQWHGYMQRPM